MRQASAVSYKRCARCPMRQPNSSTSAVRSASSRSDCSTMRWASSSAACTRASTVWPASAARTPSSACPAPACMRRSRSMDALNGAIQCDSTSVSLDSPSSLFRYRP